MDGLTDGQTDRRTDKLSYSDARTHLKSLLILSKNIYYDDEQSFNVKLAKNGIFSEIYLTRRRRRRRRRRW